MLPLENRRIVVAVSGGIAAYKSADLVSRLRKAGAGVRVAMTPSALQFVAPLTFEALSGHPVYKDIFERPSAWEMEHISWARWADASGAAPATANLLARLAHGIADDPVTTLALAFTGPLFVAPAMNSAMWTHAATRANVATLAGRGVRLIEPDAGALACGEVGPGRLAAPAALVAELERFFAGAGAAATPSSLAGRTVLVTAGPTVESLDPIRILTNRSTGRMGAALAAEAAARGARVLLVHGPLRVGLPGGVECHPVESAREMLAAVEALWPAVDAAIFAAAVANYEAAAAQPAKIKGGDTLSLELRRTPDIAAWAGAHRRPGQLLAGFAAESEDLLGAARRKLAAKRLDIIFANPIGEAGIGFEAADNQVILVDGNGLELQSPRAAKPVVAAWILERLGERLPAAASPAA